MASGMHICGLVKEMAKYAKRGKYWSYCTRNCAITNAYLCTLYLYLFKNFDKGLYIYFFTWGWYLENLLLKSLRQIGIIYLTESLI